MPDHTDDTRVILTRLDHLEELLKAALSRVDAIEDSRENRNVTCLQTHAGLNTNFKLLEVKVDATTSGLAGLRSELGARLEVINTRLEQHHNLYQRVIYGAAGIGVAGAAISYIIKNLFPLLGG